MGAYRFSVKTIYHAGVVILGIFATTMMVLGLMTIKLRKMTLFSELRSNDGERNT